jgi:ankyrin repeat protein
MAVPEPEQSGEAVSTLEKKDQLGTTPLIRASQAGSIGELERLVGAGADMNAADKWGRTSLMWASREGHTDVVAYLIEKGAKLDTLDVYGQTAYVWSQIKGNPDAGELLLDAGCMYLTNGDGELLPRDMVAENKPEVKELKAKLKAAGDMNDSKGLRSQ